VISFAALIHNRVALIAPIKGVSIGIKNDKSTWRIDFKDEATTSQRQAARDVILAFDVMLAEREQAIEDTRKARRQVLLEKLLDEMEAKVI
jgi:hypothetical protein